MGQPVAIVTPPVQDVGDIHRLAGPHDVGSFAVLVVLIAAPAQHRIGIYSVVSAPGHGRTMS